MNIECLVNFLKKTSNDMFLFSPKRNEDLRLQEDILFKLPIPLTLDGTKKAAKQWRIDYNFSAYNLEQ